MAIRRSRDRELELVRVARCRSVSLCVFPGLESRTPGRTTLTAHAFRITCVAEQLPQMSSVGPMLAKIRSTRCMYVYNCIRTS